MDKLLQAFTHPKEKQTLQRHIAFVFLVAMITLLLVEFISFHSLNRLISSAQMVSHSHQVISQLEALLSNMREAELSKRAYVFSQEDQYLQAFEKSASLIGERLATLKRMTRDNSIHQKNLQILVPDIAKELKEARVVILTRREAGIFPAMRMLEEDRSLRQMQNNQAILNGMVALEDSLLHIRDRENKNSTTEVLFAYFLGTLFVLSLLIVAYLMINREMVRRHEAEVQIQNLNEELEKELFKTQTANKELEAFSYSVSHDLRAPLRSIDGFSKLLAVEYMDKVDEEGQSYLRFISENTAIMGQLIDDLLKLSRVTRQELKKQTVNLSQIASATIDDLKMEAQHQGRDVTFVVGENIAAECDPALLQIALQNLLENAFKFTGKRDHANIEFNVMITQDESSLPETVYFVKDNGAGFDMKYVGKLFGAFQRLHEKTEFSGTGIGLATVQRIIHRHGGKVWAEGKVDGGATIYFTLAS